MTLYGEFLRPDHPRMHKWDHYFPIYETHFARFRNRHVTLFEIGVGEGGSLAMWRRYLGPHATIVGLDIYPRCRQAEEDQVHVRIGTQADAGFLQGVVAEFGAPDIVIDDGSHLQHHVNASFAALYPQVARNGVYLVEDLHAAYWSDHGGGLWAQGSFIETAKTMIDRMHVDYSAAEPLRTAAADRTAAIHFYDSVVVFEVGERRAARNRTTGDATLFRQDWHPPGVSAEVFARQVEAALAQLETPSAAAPPTGSAPESDAAAASALAAASLHAARSAAAVMQTDQQLRAELAALRASTSWRLTAPLRGLGRLLGRGTDRSRS